MLGWLVALGCASWLPVGRRHGWGVRVVGWSLVLGAPVEVLASVLVGDWQGRLSAVASSGFRAALILGVITFLIWSLVGAFTRWRQRA